MREKDHYISVPKTGSGAGVLVLHSWWGLNSFFRRLCGRLASAGFVALAPDLYGGSVAKSIEEAKVLRAAAMAARKEPVYRFLIRKIEYLAALTAVSSQTIGVLGFSMGGHWALWLSQRPELPISATTVFYACRNGDYSRTNSAFQCHFAENDAWVSDSGKRKLLRTFENEHITAEIYSYANTNHWFMESDQKEFYRPKAAKLAWSRTLSFLRNTL